MAENAQHRRIEVSGANASEEEAGAIVAALELFLAETASAPTEPGISGWQRAALLEGVDHAPELVPWMLGR